jgi:nucleoside-diphosphate-sugar epimerase
MTEKVLVTGGAGFIGSQLGHALHLAGHQVTLVDNMSDGQEDNLMIGGKRFGEFVLLDVRDPRIAKVMAGHDVVFHFAGTSSLPKCQADPGAAYDNNVTATVQLLELARRQGARRFIFSSTSAVYENTKHTPFSEEATLSPDLVYASTKLAAERACLGISATTGLDIAVMRFFNVYGEHQDIHRTNPPFLSYLSREVAHGRRPQLFNNTNAARDYVYVSDVIDMLQRVMASDTPQRGDVYNVCSGVGYSVPDLVDLFARVTGCDVEPDYREPTQFWDKFPAIFEGAYPLSRERIKDEVWKHSIGDPAKAEASFGFRARTSLENGLERIWTYAQKQIV